MRSSLRLIGAVVLCVVGLGGLAGCTPAGLQATSTATQSPTSTARHTASPAAHTTLTCAELVSNQRVSALVGAQVAAVADTHALQLVTQPTAYRIEAAGGTTCTWGLPNQPANGIELTVQLLPGAGAAWDSIASWYPATAQQGANYGIYQSRGGDCETTNAMASCRTNVLAGQNWLTVDATSTETSALTEARFHETVDQIVRIAARASAGSAIPSHPGATACTADAYAAAAAKAYGSPTGSFSPPENVFRIEAAVLLVPGAELCPFQPSTDGSGGIMVTLEVMPAARNEFDAYRALLATSATASSAVTVPGSSGPGIGRTIDIGSSPQYVLDVMKGNDWLRLSCDDIDSAPTHAAAFATWVLAH